MIGERAFVARIRELFGAGPSGQVWIGDDAAVLAEGRLAATDALVDGVHFDLAWSSAEDVGWKAMAVNLSDIAAMAGTPEAALLTIVAPTEPRGLAGDLAAGAHEAAQAYGCPIVGGDTTAGPVLMVAVTALGTSPEGGPVLRSGARPGDWLFVTGSLGGAARILAELREGRRLDPEVTRRLRRPEPRLAEGRAAAEAGATAMIDISDGLALDLTRLCDESRVGVRLDEGRVPAAANADVADALAGGDEYELCFAAPDKGRVVAVFTDRGLTQPVEIGQILDLGEGRVVRGRDAADHQLEATGWEHDIT